jgi:hypothetical protein
LVARLYRKTKRIGGAAAPDILGYLRVKLLALPQPPQVAQPVAIAVAAVAVAVAPVAVGGEVGD